MTQQQPEIDFWLGKVPSESSKKQYRARFKQYLEWAKKTPAELLALKDNGDSQAEKLLDRFVSESPYTPAQTCNIVTAVRSFYRCHYKDLSRQTQLQPARRQTQTRVHAQRKSVNSVHGVNVHARRKHPRVENKTC